MVFPLFHTRIFTHHLQSPRMPYPLARQVVLPQTCTEGEGERDHLLFGTAFAHAVGVLQCRMHGGRSARVRQSVLQRVQGAVLLAYVNGVIDNKLLVVEANLDKASFLLLDLPFFI
ncbi:MAG: hypothetical protein PHX87_00855 [Candidatus Peribacteraceae bacterium]|nr:hypothetical protein [Candidatus Peribacteraceae bacterium]MDD5741958.1 hypothetical protein [Candidatus Peribacteraceae bacterium]